MEVCACLHDHQPTGLITLKADPLSLTTDSGLEYRSPWLGPLSLMAMLLQCLLTISAQSTSLREVHQE